MIALGTTPEQLLAEIGAGPFDAGRNDPADRRLVDDAVASVVVRGTVPDDILPRLLGALTERFSHVSRERLRNDLVAPLKKGVGNAYRRGNLKDPSKRITVKAAVTYRGAVFVVSDEGEGFDFEGVVERFRRDEKYFQRLGSGFTKFHATRSLVSYADGGRTFLFRFLSDLQPGRPKELAVGADLGAAGDKDFMAQALARHLPVLASGAQELVACEVFVPEESKHEQWDVKYELTCRERATGSEQVMVLTGSRTPPDAARTWLGVAADLRRVLRDGVRVPETVAVLDHPALVLFAFNPDRDLRRILRRCEGAAEATACIAPVGACLRALHGSALELLVQSPEQHFARHAAVARDAARILAEHDPDVARRVEEIAARLARRVASLAPCPAVPIHGDFGWNRIVEGEQSLYLVGFEHFCRSHPGFDLGGAVADLVRFYSLRDGADTTHRADVERALHDAYAGGRPPPWLPDLPVFVAATLLLRLGRLLARPRKKWVDKVEPLVELCESVLAG